MESWKSPHSLEVLCCSVQLNFNKSFLICVVYRTSHVNNDIVNLETIFSKLSSMGKPFYVTGDFNINMLKSDASSKQLKNVLNKFSIRQLVTHPTRGPNLLDLIITNDTSYINVSTEESLYYASDHLVTKFYLPITKSRIENKTIHYRDYKNIDIIKLNQEVELRFPMKQCINEVSVFNIDTYLKHMLDSVLAIFNKLAPVKTFSVKEKDVNIPISAQLKKLKRDAFFHYKRWVSTKLNFHLDLSKSLKKIIKNQARSDARKHFGECIEKQGIWNSLHNVFNLNFKSKGSCNYDELDPNELNKYFTEIPFPPGTAPYYTLEQSLVAEIPTSDDVFYVHEVTDDDLRHAWKQIKKKGSTKSDITGTCIKMVNILFQCPNFFNELLNFCNLSFQTGKVPSILKITRIVPVPKCSNAKSNNEFRPVGISPFFMTILEKIYFKKLNAFVENSGFLSKYQFGGRKGHSTEHAMISIVDVIRKKVDMGMICILISLDLRNAFPSVHREKLLLKNKNTYKISDFWLRDYLKNTYQYVDINGALSRLIEMRIGVIQGSTIGGPFFTYFINDLADIIKIAVPEKFVDDTNLAYFDYSKNLDVLVKNIESELKRVNEWVEANSLALNSNKTKMLVISTPRRINSISTIDILFNGIIIEQCDTLKCLGLTIDSTLSWDTHINKIAKVCYYRLNSLYKIRQFIPNKYKLLLANALVLSLVSYMSTLWSSASKSNVNTMEKVIRSLARFISGKQKYDSVAPIICNDLKWLFPNEIGIFNILCIMYKLSNVVPIEYFKNYFVLRSATHSYSTSLCTSGALAFNYVPQTRYGLATFHYRAIELWNNLPSNIKQCTSTYMFKNKLKIHLLDNQKNRLDIS
jgi:hypothetical protein